MLSVNMKIVFCAVFILLYFDSQAVEHHGFVHEKGTERFHDPHHHVHEIHSDLDNLGNFNKAYSYNNILRPCLFDDMKCIYDFFKHNHMCTLPLDASKPYIIKKSVVHVPHANFSLTINNAELRGLESGKVREFYINKKKDTLVFEVEFETLVVDSPKSLATYYRKGQEPMEVVDFTFIDLKKMSLTLTIQHLHNADLQRTHVYAYLSDPNLPYMVGPRFGDSRALTYMKKKWLGYIQLSALEAMVSQAPIYMSAYLRSQICDYKNH